ncbi:MAG: LexA family transcriptional regulator [Ruminococcaceae bacterium]|nr:LexA family transcriptional regulator [Oscillospiraceae bacterium]
MSFSERVKRIKKEKGITNDALSAASGIPLGTLGKLLSGFTEEPKLSTAISIAEALGCSLEYLAVGKEEQPELSEIEKLRLEKYRALDAHGMRVCDFILNEEYLRSATVSRNVLADNTDSLFHAKVGEKKAKMIKIPFFADRVSAGSGVHLESNDATEISVVENEKTKRADFALRVSGDSMEPRYHDGDILLVENTPSIEVGELGIFICDGEGYFKELGNGCLISLNKKYEPIPLSQFESFSCRGTVIGTLRQRG